MIFDLEETRAILRMIETEHLDIRTVTLGISLRGCATGRTLPRRAAGSTNTSCAAPSAWFPSPKRSMRPTGCRSSTSASR
jgi:hypothetical protein